MYMCMYIYIYIYIYIFIYILFVIPGFQALILLGASWVGASLVGGGHGALQLGSGRQQIFQLKCSHEMSILIIILFLWVGGGAWSHNGCPKLEECDKNKSGISKKTGLEHVYMKVTKSVQIDAL